MFNYSYLGDSLFNSIFSRKKNSQYRTDFGARNPYLAETDTILMKLFMSMSSKTHDTTQIYEENTYPLYIPRKTHKEITSSAEETNHYVKEKQRM